MAVIRVETHDYVFELTSQVGSGIDPMQQTWRVGQPNKNRTKKMSGVQKQKLCNKITKRGYTLLRAEDEGTFLVYGRRWQIDEAVLNANNVHY